MIETVAAHPRTFDQGDTCAERRRAGGRHQSGCAAANDHPMVAIRWPWIAPIGGPNECVQPRISVTERVARHRTRSLLLACQAIDLPTAAATRRQRSIKSVNCGKFSD
jgi:hypothetical protein